MKALSLKSLKPQVFEADLTFVRPTFVHKPFCTVINLGPVSVVFFHGLYVKGLLVRILTLVFAFGVSSVQGYIVSSCRTTRPIPSPAADLGTNNHGTQVHQPRNRITH